MPPGRNDPCPCGSGKKYKHCCLPKGEVADALWHRQHRLNQELPTRLLSFVKSAFGAGALEEAWREFTLWDEAAPAFSGDSPHVQVFLPWFLYFWRPDPHDTESLVPGPLRGRSAAEHYLAQSGPRLDAFERRYLDACLQSVFSFHEVLACLPGQSLRLRDVLSGAECEVTEKSGSRNTQPGDLIFACVVRLDHLAVLDGCSAVIIPPIEKGPILALRKKLRKSKLPITSETLRDYSLELLEIYHDIVERLLHPPRPVLFNTDNEPFALHKLVFEIDSPRRAFDALKHLALDQAEEELLRDAEFDASGSLKKVSFPWLKRGNARHKSWNNTILGHLTIEDRQLTAEVNSEARAQRFRALIEERLGAAVRHKATVIESTEALLDAEPDQARMRRHRKEQQKLLAQPEVRAELEAFLRDHYASWADEKIPALGNRTPRQAVKTADGREMVAALLAQAERDLKRDYPWMESSPLAAVRQELGLVRSSK